MRSESGSGHQTFQVKMMGFGELSLISTYEWLCFEDYPQWSHTWIYFARDEWGGESRIVVSAVFVLRSLLKLN